MQLAILASPTINEAFREQFPEVDWIAAASGINLLSLARNRALDAVVIDGRDATSPDLIALRELQRIRSLPVVISGEITPLFARAALDLSQWSNPRFVFGDVRSEPERLRKFLLQCPPARTRDALLTRTCRRLAELPPRLFGAIHQLWDEPPEKQSTGRLAVLSGYSPRWVHERLISCGVTQPHALVDAPAVINAWAYASDPGFTLINIARKSGHRTIRSLHRLTMSLAEAAPRPGLASLTERVIVERLIRKLFHS